MEPFGFILFAVSYLWFRSVLWATKDTDSQDVTVRTKFDHESHVQDALKWMTNTETNRTTND